MHQVSDKVWRERLFYDDYSPIFYTHKIFGGGYVIIDYCKKTSWCELKKFYSDGSCSMVADYFNKLKKEKRIHLSKRVFQDKDAR